MRQGSMGAFKFRSPGIRSAPRHLSAVTAVVDFGVIFAFVLPTSSAVNLSCYSCSTTDPRNVCYNNVTAVPIKRCADNFPSMTCSVYREDVAGKFNFIKRGCNSSCEQKCGAWGDDIDIDKCASCCTTDLCNVDDAASIPWSTTNTCLQCLWLTITLWLVAGVLRNGEC